MDTMAEATASLEADPWFDFDEADMENIRSLAIFFGYLATAALLALTCIFIIFRQYRLRRKGQHIISSSSQTTTTTTTPANGDKNEKKKKQTIESASASPTAIPGTKVLIFALLAAASLATTWYYMYAFFEYSYQQWYVDQWVNYLFDGSWLTSLLPEEISSAILDSSAEEDISSALLSASGSATTPTPTPIPTPSPSVAPTRPHITRLQLGPWLRDTSLFQEAWNAAMATDARFWWSHQIFGLCWVWSLVLGRAARSRGKRIIPGTWVFMLLGQIVAISFAMNLSFLAILVSPRVTEGREKNGKKGEKEAEDKGWSPWVHHFLSVATFTSVLVIMYVRGMSAWELPALLTPHVLVFLPVTICPPSSKVSGLMSPRSIAVSLAVLVAGLATTQLIDASEGANIVEVLFHQASTVFYEHPAVTSVSWDVVLCWTSFIMWNLIGENE